MIQNETTIVVENYDYTGAMIYIIIVLLWYSVGIIFMLGMQMRARSETIEESARRRTKLLIRNLRDHTNTKEILEELVDKQKRARLWDIYLGTTINKKEKLTRAESVRIRHIEKQLATINRNHRIRNETLFPSQQGDIYYEHRGSDARQITRQLSADVESTKLTTTLRRGSSFDQQTLERWKALANQSKPHEQIPWNIRKLMIRRYFRRHAKKLLPVVRQESTTDNPASCPNNINILTRRHHSEIDLHLTPTDAERQNPYLSYFYAPSNHRSILTSESSSNQSIL